MKLRLMCLTVAMPLVGCVLPSGAEYAVVEFSGGEVQAYDRTGVEKLTSAKVGGQILYAAGNGAGLLAVLRSSTEPLAVFDESDGGLIAQSATTGLALAWSNTGTKLCVISPDLSANVFHITVATEQLAILDEFDVGPVLQGETPGILFDGLSIGWSPDDSKIVISASQRAAPIAGRGCLVVRLDSKEAAPFDLSNAFFIGADALVGLALSDDFEVSATIVDIAADTSVAPRTVMGAAQILGSIPSEGLFVVPLTSNLVPYTLIGIVDADGKRVALQGQASASLEPYFASFNHLTVQVRNK